jgi:proteasome lid subunit RPN8/RPN11
MAALIPEEFLERIREQAEKDYPNETCGILAGPIKYPERITTILPCPNVQDQYHQADPVSFPRTARTAYFIDPRDLLRIQRQTRENGEEMRAIYHSHTDAGAYFSEEDQRIALSEGGPTYPGVSYLVTSVLQGKAAEVSIFTWDPQSKAFKGASLKKRHD